MILVTIPLIINFNAGSERAWRGTEAGTEFCRREVTAVCNGIVRNNEMKLIEIFRRLK
jgi:hypothetical protein